MTLRKSKEMTVVKRWRVKWDETEIPDGEYVRVADYDALASELAEYRADGSGIEIAQAAIIKADKARIRQAESIIGDISGDIKIFNPEMRERILRFLAPITSDRG